MVGCGASGPEQTVNNVVDAGIDPQYDACTKEEIGHSVCANGNRFTCGTFAAWTDKGNLTFSKYPGNPTWIVNSPCP